MCIFSGAISSVSSTQIFARSSDHGKQFLAYTMAYEADSELAMILPLPTPPFPPEDAVRFIDLSTYPHFFSDLSNGFPQTKSFSRSAFGLGKPPLQIQEVGSFEASFVPNKGDFIRLDERFHLPHDIWHQLPIYRDYGFAVFKLKAGEKKVHPMAFEFPRRDPEVLFFPTVHVHHGHVESRAEFNHILYQQSQLIPTNDSLWEVSPSGNHESGFLNAQHFVNIKQTQGIVDPNLPIQRQRINGLRSNKDILVRETM